MVRLRRTFATLFVGCVVAAGLAVTSSAADAAINCTNGTSMDVGYTVMSDGKIKGSASYTTCPNRPVLSADIWIRRNGYALGITKVHIGGIATPSSKAFSPKDYACVGGGVGTFDTYVIFHHSSGETDLSSNKITVSCG